MGLPSAEPTRRDFLCITAASVAGIRSAATVVPLVGQIIPDSSAIAFGEIVAGNGLGLVNTSLKILGPSGVLGQSVLGQGSSRAFVNAVNGNLVLQMRDAQLAGRGSDLYASRTYNSLGMLNDSDGNGWRWGYERAVRFQGLGTPAQPEPGDAVIRTAGDGHETTYIWDSARAAYVSTEGGGPRDELTYDSAPGEWVWTNGATRVRERYSHATDSNITDRLISRIDTSGNSIVLMYDGERLTAIQDSASQQELRLVYGLFNGFTRVQRLETRALTDDVSGRATATLGGALRQVEYSYDNSGRLTTVTADLTPADGSIVDGVVFVTSYTYDGSTTRIASVTQSDGTSVFFTYDAGKISAIKDQSGATSTQLAFNYSTVTNSTGITDGNGQVWTYRYDGTSRQLTEIVSPMLGASSLSTKFKYDASGNLASITDQRNNTVIYENDSNGNRTLECDSIGNTVTRTFSAANQILTETRYRVADPDGVGPQSASDPLTTRYAYDTSARLRFVVSPEGRVMENRYGTADVGYGLLTHTLQYVGQPYDVSGLDPIAQLTESQLAAWVVALQDKTQIQLTEYSYDLRGNMSQRTSYGSVSAAGNGVLDNQAGVTEYIYDAQTHLGQQIAVRGTARDQRTPIASFTYDGIGRALTASGASGAQTTVYDDANGRIAMTTASGLTERRSYDSRHRLVSVTQAGDAASRQTTYVYNNADQLRMAEDAQGSRRYRFYDAAGRLEYSVDATGAVTGFEYSATGQIVRRTRYQTRADISNWYDGATLTVTKGSLTVGGAGSDVPIDPALDRATSFDYDAAGQLTTSTDAVGIVTTTSYDGLSRVIMTQTGDRVTRQLYDRDNRKVGVVDPLGYLTEYKYDAGGRLVETARYSQRSPAAANITAPVWIGITNQNATGGKPFEYRLPAYDADGDRITLSLVGTPPGWLSFDAAVATLRGTPPAMVASYSVTLRADDGRGKTADVTLFIVVATSDPSSAGGTGPAWGSLSPLNIVADTAVNYVVPPATGQSLTYRAVSGMPPGLSFDPATLTITGTSTAVGFYTIVLRATNASGGSVDRTLSVQIRTAPATRAQPTGSDQLSSWLPSDTSALRSYVYYDGQGRVIGSVDEQQFLTETVYDDALNTKKTLRYLTPVIVLPSDTMASLKSRAGASFQTSLIQYDGFGRVLETTELDGSTLTHNEYDAAGRLVRTVTAANTSEQRARRTFYNAFGEVIAIVGGEGDAWLGTNPTEQQISEAIRDYGIHHEYDTVGRKIRSVDANGNQTLFYYDRENRLSHTINVIGQSANNTLAGEVSETTYNTFGETATVRRYATRLAAADVAQLLAGGGGLADQSLLHKLAALANTSLDQVSSYEYDGSGRLLKQVDGENGVTVNFYNAFGELAAQVRSTRQGQNTAKQFDYDLNGRLVSTTDDAGGINSNTRTTYDALGRVTESIDGAGKVTTTVYQDSGRTVVVTDPLNRATRTEYDALGRVFRVTNALNQQTVHAYDEAARSATITTPEGVRVTTVRTRHGEISSLTDGRGNVTRHAYNKDGQITTATDPLGQVIARTIYDRSGRKFQLADARGVLTQLNYDQRNRVFEQRVDPNGLNLTTQFEFNALGQQIKVTEGANTVAARVTTYTYDRKNQLTQIIIDPTALKLSTRYTFDGIGNTVKIEQGTTSNPSQRVTLAEFDQLGRRVKKIVAPSAVFGPGSPDSRDLATKYRYNAAGRLSCTIHPDGTSTWYVYDAADQKIQTIDAMGEVSESVYDANGRVVQSRRYFNRLSAQDLAKLGDAITAPVTPQVNTNDQRSYFVYDNDGRQRCTLQATIGTSWAIAENRFDANGNIVEMRRYDKLLPEARLNAIDTSASPGISVAEIQTELITLGYSDADSTLVKTQRTRFAYDANNRLRFTVDALGSVIESAYDPAGQLVSSVRYATRPTLTAITETAIDAALNRANARNQVSHYAYDAAGKLRYSVLVLASDATGKPTEQLVREQVYDSLGRVVQTIAYATLLGPIPDYKAATLASAMTAGPQDRRSAFVYDAAGRNIYSVQVQIAGSQNIVSKREFDAMDRLVESTSYAKTMALADFGKATLDSATTNNASAQDRTSTFVCDAVGRQRFAVGADGSSSEKVYDALGRVKESRQFDLLLSNTTPRTEGALSAWRAGRAVGDGTTRGVKYGYDRAGRLLTTTDAAGFTETNEYNALGDKTAFTDKNGGKWRYTYDRQGRLFDQYSPPVPVQLSNETAPASRSLQTRLYHDAFGSLVEQVEAVQTVDQRITRYAYDRLGRQIVMAQPGWYDLATGRVEAISAAGRFQRSLEMTYDALGNKVRTKLRTGINSYQYEYKTYDNLGRVVYDVDALSNVTAFAYDAFGEQTSVIRYSKSVGTPPQGVDTPWTTTALASALGSDPLARMMTMRYDNVGRKTQTIQPAVASYFFSGSISRFVPLDNSITPVSASGGTTFEYSPFGELFHQAIQLDSTRAQETWRYYDTMGRETRTIFKSNDNIAGEGSPPRPGGFHTARSYDAFGNLTQVIEYAAQGEADNSGNSLMAPPTPNETSADRISSYVYDARNQHTDALRSNLSYAALENGQYVQVELGRGNSVKVRHNDYDSSGRVIASTDAMNNITRSAYNALGQLIQVTEPARLVVKSGLSNPDPFLVGSQVLTSPVTDLVLNPFGQTVKSTRSPGRSDVAGATLITNTGYDLGGNAISTTDAKGNVKNWQYDFSGRLIKETQATSSTLGARLTELNHVLQVWKVVSYTRERRYAYDAVGHMTDALDVFMNGSTLAQSGQRKVFNAFGEVTEEQIVWGSASDALSELQHATRLHYSYDNAGNLVTQNGADGQTQFFYNLTGQMTRAEQRGDNSTADGTHTRVGETGYDLMGRTVWQSKPIFLRISDMVTPTSSITLDRWGNLIHRTEVGDLGNGLAASIRNLSYAYNADNKVISAELGFAQALRADGTSYPANVTHQTRYDLAGRAVEQIDVAENTLTFSVGTLRTRSTTYDGIGQVVEEKDAEQFAQGQHGQRYVYDANRNKVATINAVGNVFVDAFDANGNQLTHKVLRLSPGGENDTYVSGLGNVPVAVLLNSHSYDQANRRIETRDYVSASLFNANYVQYDERGFVRGTFQLQETDGSTPSSVDPGRETSYVYDILGNKIRQTDDSGHSMAWSYNTAADGSDQPNLTINRLTSATSTAAGGGFNHSTAYTYTDFGQVKQETYTGTDIADATAQNNRVYEYNENGLLAKTTDHQTVGTPGSVGGLDYWSSTSINKYSYTDRGRVFIVDIDTTGFYEDYAQFGGVIQTKAAQTERRTISTTYDDRDRPVTVINSCFDSNGVSKHSSANVTYDYDELGNHTRITFSSIARSTMPGENTFTHEIINGRQLWFNYNHEGRMTLANKTIEQNGTVTDVGVVITYDAAGRRATTLTPEGRVEVGGEQSWDQSRLERYTYNDLGYLTKIEQAGVRSNKRILITPVQDDPGPSPFMPSETRSYDLLGNLAESSQYSHFMFVNALDMTMQPQSLQVTVQNQYTAAGLLDTQTSTHPTGPRANTGIKNVYDNHGILQSYTYTQGDGLGNDADHGFKNTYTYSYLFKAGALREGGIAIESNLRNSTTTRQYNTYDGRGNLVWQHTIDGPGNTEMVFFDYEGSGRVLDKANIQLPPDRLSVSGDKYNSFFYNPGGEAIGNVPASSFAATSADHANFGIGFTPVSSTYPSSQPSSYAVVPGDTLADIAKSFLGDAQLWYLIADANGLTAGPADPLDSQVGRSLRIPNVVANAHNNADTFSPYNPNPIVSSTPWVGAPLPPPGLPGWEESILQAAPYFGVEVSVVLSVVLSGLGPLGAGIASAAGDVVNQSIQSGFGGKNFDYGEVGEAGLMGSAAGELSALGSAAASATGNGLAAQALAQAGAGAAAYAVNSGIYAAFHHGKAPASFGGWSLLTATTGAAATPVLGGFFSRLAQDALNPQTGWVWHPNARAWDAFYQELVMGLGQVVIQDSFGSPRNEPRPEQRSQPTTLPAALLEKWDEIDMQFYKADLAAQAAAEAEQPDVISSADLAAEQQSRLVLTVASDHDIVQALRSKQIYVVQKGDRNTEDVAEHMGHDRRDGSYLTLKNGYDPRNVQEGQVFYNFYVSPEDARLANALVYPIEQQAAYARNERHLQQELAAGRQKAALEAAQAEADAEELRGIIGEPPSLETLANLTIGVAMHNPAAQAALSNPDLGTNVPVFKTTYYQGTAISYVSGLHEIGSQPAIDADWSANTMIIEMVDIQTPSEIANRTGQSNYLNYERYMKRFPSASPQDYFQYRAGADQEQLGIWDRYSNAYGVVKVGLGLEVGLALNPVGTLESLGANWGSQRIASAAGYGEFAPEIGGIFSILVPGAISLGKYAVGSALTRTLPTASTEEMENAMGGSLSGPSGPWIRFSRSAAEANAFRDTIEQIEGRLPPPQGPLGRNWGATFNNRPLQPGRAPELPVQPPGYYNEYTTLLPDQATRGTLRTISGAGGEVYTSWTHYGTDQPFFPIDPQAPLPRVPFLRAQ